MSFLRRILGGEQPAAPAVNGPTAEEDEVERERAIVRAEAERLSGDLLARQMRYADRSWTPPAQGSSRRADDTEGTADD